MFRKSKALTSLLLFCIFLGTAAARTVFLLPNSSSTTPLVAAFQPDSNTLITNFAVQGSASAILAHPTANKYYVLAKSVTDTVAVVDGANFNAILKRLSLGQGEAMAITPDGRKLVVVAGSVFIIDTTSDSVVATIADAGNSPNDVAISLDGTRAFVLNSTQNRLTSIDLTTNTTAGSVVVPGLSTSVTVAPNGLVYVTAVNRIFEIDGRTLTTRKEIQLNARPGRLVYTSDGKYALCVNQTPVTGSSVLLFDLIAGTLAGTIPNFNTIITNLYVAGDNKVYAHSNDTQTLYELSIVPFNINVASFSNIGSINNVQYVTTTNELPSPKYMFIATPGSMYRIDLQQSPPAGTGQVAIPLSSGALTFSSTAISGTPTRLFGYNQFQSTTAGSAYLPLIVRAVDATGRPLNGASVVFTTDNAGATIQGASLQTNAQGYALTTVLAPANATTFKVTASTAGGSVTADFTLTVGSTTGGGGGGSTGIGGLSIVDGDGQFATENFLLQEPLTIQVKDAAGKPIPGQSVTFSVAQGLGTMQSNLANGTPIPNTTCQGLSCTSISDANGMAQAGMLAATVSPGFSYSQTIIAATNGSSTVNFTITTVQGQTAPTAQRLAPAEGVLINAPAGTIIKDAVQVRVFSSAGVQAGQPIANIGVKATTGNDPLLGPTATCVGGTVLTDSTGTANCSLLIGGKLGNAQITVLVGSSQQLGGAPINIRVTPGPPSKINLRQGNNQSGNPGATLPLAFLAEISDAYGNPLPGQTAQFEVVDAGSITLLNVVTVADSNGRVSALGRLGSLPGAHQVRVRSGSITASFTFTVNVNVTVLQATTGSDQVANLNSPFGLPLTVRLLDDRNQPVTGASISWAVVTGTATLSAANSTTGTDGTASVTISSGSVSGPVTVRAAYSNLATNFNLTVRIPGPVFTAGSITNAASGAPGVVPCGIANIFGSNFSKVSGVISAVGLAGGPLPTSYQGVEVLFDSNLAPIYAVANQNGQEQITVQVPCNLASPGTVSVTIRGTASTTVTGVQVNRVQPGIFETSDGPGQRRYAVLLRPDGSYVTNANPARRGDVLRMFVTGLGAVTPETATNRAGAGGQTVSAPLVVGVNDAGVRIVSSEYAVGMIGVYIVSFEIPSDTAGGTFRPLALAADPGTGNLTYGQGSSIANIQ